MPVNPYTPYRKEYTGGQDDFEALARQSLMPHMTPDPGGDGGVAQLAEQSQEDQRQRSAAYRREQLLASLQQAAGTAPPMPTPVNVDTSGAYTQARDRAALDQQTGLSSLHEELQRRGLGGAGYEAGRAGQVISEAGSRRLQDTSVAQAHESVAAQQHTADQQFESQMAAYQQQQQQQTQMNLERLRQALSGSALY